MSTYGFYDVTLVDGGAPLAWFRAQVAERGGDRVEVDAHPTSLAALAAFVGAHRVTFDHVGVVQRATTTTAVDDVQRLARELPRLSYVHVTLRRAEERLPWSALGLRKRKVLRETEHLQLQLELGYAFAWLAFDGAPALRGGEVATYEAWRDAQEIQHLTRGLAGLGVDRLPAPSAWEQLRRPGVDGAGPAAEIVTARPRGAGTSYLFPLTSALTAAIPLTAAGPREIAAAMLRAPALPHELELQAGGSVAEVVAAARWWPAPDQIVAPQVEPIASRAVEVPTGFTGRLSFRARLATGPRGGATEVTLHVDDHRAPRLVVVARGGLDDQAVRRIEQALGVRLALAFAG